MSDEKKESYTNHKMNFIIGLSVGAIFGIILAFFIFIDKLIDIGDLISIVFLFGISGGITGFIIGLTFDIKKIKMTNNVIFNSLFRFVLIFAISLILTIIVAIIFELRSEFFEIMVYMVFFSNIIVGTFVVHRTLKANKNATNIKINQPTPKPDIKLEPLHEAPVNTIKEDQSTLPSIEKHDTRSLKNIEVKSAFSYKGATILYKIKVENPTLEPIGDIKVNLYVPDVFLVSESTKTIVMLKPSESKTVTFEIRPTGECGDCEVSGKVVYYDYSTKKTSEIEIPAKNLSIVCPMLHSKEISENAWRNALSGFAKAEESTKEIDMPASTLFDITTDILQDMNLYMLEPKINDSSNLYRGVAKFYGEGVKELKYAAQIEVVGGTKKSKLILKSWAEREDALTGFYHGVLDEIEKRVHVKGYINDNIVQNFHHHGDNIGTQVKDSLVQRSNIGTGTDAKKCPNCNRDVNTNEKFCLECGTKI